MLIGLMVSFLNYVVSLIFPDANVNKGIYTVDFADWNMHLTGNIMLILLIISVSLGAGLMASGIITRGGRRPFKK